MNSTASIKQHQSAPFTGDTLCRENVKFRNTCGVSDNNGDWGFHPAFRDNATGTVYLSRFPDGRAAPVHLLDGLPEDLVLKRSPTGRISALRHTVVSGFWRTGQFYTRAQAAAACI